jgi:hypothetical protein
MTNKRRFAAAALLLTASAASAHVSYTGRDFILNGGFDGAGTYTLLGQRVTSAYGWADAADADRGDSHRGRFMKFSLSAPADVTLKVWQQDDVAYTSAGQSLTALNDLVPAFSLYSGLAVGAAHEGSDHPGFLAAHPGYIPTAQYFDGVHVGPAEGAWRATYDFVMGNSSSEVAPGLWSFSQLTYLGHALDGAGVDVSGDRVLDFAGDGAADGIVQRTFRLGPGAYSLVVGGTCYACQFVEPTGTLLAQRGFAASLTLAPVPEPGTWALMAAGLGLLAAGARRARRMSA